MIDSIYLRELVDEALAKEKAFLIGLDMKAGDRIELLADHMDGLTLERITSISRHIRNGLDEREYDYALEVSSPGVGTPLIINKQYIKNIGRTLEVKTTDGTKVKGELVDFKDDVLQLEFTVREPKEIGKGKQTVTKNKKIALAEVESAKVLVKF